MSAPVITCDPRFVSTEAISPNSKSRVSAQIQAFQNTAVVDFVQHLTSFKPQGICSVIREWLAVALGGMIGTLARHALNSLVRSWHPSWLPLSTLAVNVVGCFAIGWLFRWTSDRELINQWWEVALRVGVLGGLTTFSSFALEVVNAGHHRPSLAIAIVLGHLVLGLLCVIAGMNLATWWR